MTRKLSEVEDYLQPISADGGGDGPEAVQRGLWWAVSENKFRVHARKVVLLFGDAPPHDEDLQECHQIVSAFHRREKGIVSTISCRAGQHIPAFLEIARAGHGEAFFLADHRRIIEQLVVLVFGSENRERVLQAFRLWDDVQERRQPANPSADPDQLVRDLQSPNVRVRDGAHVELSLLGPTAVPALLRALRDPQLRGSAVRVLCDMGPDAESAVAELISGMKDPDPLYRSVVHHTLVELGPIAVPELARTIEASDEFTWYSALVASR